MPAEMADLAYASLAAPAVLLFGDDPVRRAALASLVEQAGGRVAASGAIAEALPRIEWQAVMGGTVLDLAEDGGPALDALLGHLEQAAVTGQARSVVIAVPELIDVVTARLAGRGATLLIAPDAAETGEAFRAMLAVRTMMLADSAGETPERRLAELRGEVSRIARSLAALSGEGATQDAACALAPPPPASDGAMIRTILRLRRLRDRHFEPALFADPAWDILLDLAAARIERRTVGVSSLCIAAAVPPTTALRWITQMTEQGLLLRRPDPADARRVFMELSDRAGNAMAGYIAAARQVMAPAA